MLDHFPLLETPTKWPNRGPWASGLTEVAVKDDGIAAGVNQRPTPKISKCSVSVGSLSQKI